ncbi:hypothetical protein CWE15_01920 [Aliidiomarina taiwanensis]|uniref:DUF5610 domain-containing protein n=1 Tax=Aliidiomarina taiwanensis TaxID=946228 RepID=A0A432X9G8_9GAMM|nr:DUF5610 domain-containing protein [Aliidiomarina taiwanensis]RUO43964.1 hypothetical protein CWE15_01920 [Aliidiomarina taiwanensis]
MSTIPGYTNTDLSKQNATKIETKQPATTNKEEAKQAQNMAILQAHEKVSLNSDNESLKLLYKAAIEGINEVLEPTMGKNAAQKVFDSNVDTSPEATAERIVSFATNFYELYKEANPGETDEETLTSFINEIMSGVDRGFAEAKDLLTGLQVFKGQVESDANETYDLIKQGIEDFREQTLSAQESAKEK